MSLMGTSRLRLLLLAGLAGLALPGSAHADRIVTWGPMESRFVDPSEAPLSQYNQPPGVAERPNALRANVYLPRGYRRHKRRHYPVLYLLHGQGDAFDSWAHPEKGDLLNTVGDFPGVIVMPEAARGFYTNWWNGGRRGDPAWERYHLEELVPKVKRRLRIRNRRRWHAIAGLSMGGGGTMFYASQRPGYFGSAASFSGAISIQRPTYQQGFPLGGDESEPIWGDEAAQEFYWRGHNPKELVESLRHTRLYVAAGNGVPGPEDPIEPVSALTELELGQQTKEFAAAAENAGIEVTYRPHGGTHEWNHHKSDLQDAIDWGLFGRPPRPERHWSYETVARVGWMWGLRFRFANPPREVIRFEREGRRLSAEGSGRVRIRTRAGCRLRAKLPFAVRLPRPRACR